MREKKEKSGFERSLGINNIKEETFNIVPYPPVKEEAEVNLRIWKSHP